VPSKSAKQHRLMALVANDPKAAKRLGISQSVGRDFMKADKGRKFYSGGSTMSSYKMDRMRPKGLDEMYRVRPMASYEMEEMPMRRRVRAPMIMRKGGKAESKEMVKKELAFMKKKGAPKSMIRHEEAEMGGKMKKGVRKFQSGGFSRTGRPLPSEAEMRYITRNRVPLGGYQKSDEVKMLEKFAKEQNLPQTYVNRVTNAAMRRPVTPPPVGLRGGRLGAALTAVGALSGLGGYLAGKDDDNGNIEEQFKKLEEIRKSKGPSELAKGGSAHSGMKHKAPKKHRYAGGGMAYSNGGSVFRRQADGVAHKGKTRGKIVKMRYGGEC